MNIRNRYFEIDHQNDDGVYTFKLLEQPKSKMTVEELKLYLSCFASVYEYIYL